MLYDIGAGAWSDELCALFDVPRACLPEVLPSSGRFGVTVPEHAAGLRVPVSGIAGDQQAALFGQACVVPGMTKNTYGTGSFVLTNLGPTLPEPVDGLLTTIAWSLAPGAVTYAMEGAIFVTGAAIQWLRDGLGVIARSGRDRPARGVGPRLRRRLRGARVHRPRLAVVGSVRARDDRRHHAGHDARASRPRRGRGDGVPDRRRGRRDHRSQRVAQRSRRCASTAARRSWTCCASSRPTCSASRCAAPRSRRPPRSARRSSPVSPRASGSRRPR